ncbi:MAG: hypothetical protein D6721_06375 [Gammaproteobacteria bacterium]|nr:MAG: hypothetical protein D6721_06375 [Gammaproteobacteria bacterium]
MRRSAALLAFLLCLLAAAVTACGQKGPLYLPDEPPAGDRQGTAG